MIKAMAQKMKKLRKEIVKLQNKLILKERKSGIYENFGQREVNKLKEKYDYLNNKDVAFLIDEFDNWASTYEGENAYTQHFLSAK